MKLSTMKFNSAGYADVLKMIAVFALKEPAALVIGLNQIYAVPVQKRYPSILFMIILMIIQKPML